VTPLMSPEARLLVYQVLPTSEVTADYLPFTVSGDLPQKVQVAFSQEEVKPGDEVAVNVQTQGPAKVGLVAVDKSVFILAENRLNLQQVFAELERLYQQPQAELHEARPIFEKVSVLGAKDVFQDAGVVVMSNKYVPDGKDYENPVKMDFGRAAGGAMPPLLAPQAAQSAAVEEAAKVPQPTGVSQDAQLADVQRVRQFFPETWIWEELTTDSSGQATKRFTAPDSITTWMMRAVALSKETGLGLAEAQLRVMQPFFVQIDLPYSVIRGERFPVKVALYNYLDTAQQFVVQIEADDWFDLADDAQKTVQVGPNEVGGVSFTISPKQLGTRQIKITARSTSAADAIVKDLIVEPEGVAREEVENAVLAAGSARQVDMSLPVPIIDGSARGYVALTGNFLTQSIQGLEGLLRMPFGCGEQNMILFAPNVFVTNYLKETGQMKPEVMAKAETLMVTGYQRELTYRRSDGSFSAFGNQDKEGSLWLTAFVLKTFAQAKGTIYIDDAVLSAAQRWIVKHQQADGSFEPVGFIHHQDMLGGLKGKPALTAYVAIALQEAGETTASAKAIRYLENSLNSLDDPYAVAITTYALELAKSGKAGAAYDKLMSMAHEGEDGLYWGDERIVPEPLAPEQPGVAPRVMPMPRPNESAVIETTAYATLALIEHGDQLTASRATKWLLSKRNALGGFGSTQDTVVGLQALTRFATNAKSDVDATVTLRSGDWQKEVRIDPTNADVLQVIDVPTGGTLMVEAKGKGQIVLQSVRRYNVPDAEEPRLSIFQMNVDYGVDEVEVNDLITVKASIKFTPPEPMEAGMVVMDVAVPTGFAPVTDSIEQLVQREPKLKRYDIAGRKVILYIEDMQPNEELTFTFQAQALYPVKAQAVTSQVYAYYQPEWRGESLGGAMEVR
ncbi:MAG: hypothetical protein M0Z94_08415, partial [Dehalococcoidales bacterium]|nr:hypothetical protein [Dehalococcoidales bacterium]